MSSSSSFSDSAPSLKSESSSESYASCFACKDPKTLSGAVSVGCFFIFDFAFAFPLAFAFALFVSAFKPGRKLSVVFSVEKFDQTKFSAWKFSVIIKGCEKMQMIHIKKRLRFKRRSWAETITSASLIFWVMSCKQEHSAD